jgi:ATP-dependent RNA helicase RhlE
VDKRNKPVLLTHILQNTSYKRALVFTRTKHGADRVAKHLHREGIEAAAIHGNKSQSQRTRALEGFRSGKVPVLIASDIAARGIDIDEISHVFNFDLPNVPETYVHRIGRTARAGAEGEAISFCDHEEKPYLKDIERLTRVHIPVKSDHPPYPTRAQHDAAMVHDAPRPTRGPARPHAAPHGGHPQRGHGPSRTGQGAGHANTHAPRKPGHGTGGHAGGGAGARPATGGQGSGRPRRRRRW